MADLMGQVRGAAKSPQFGPLTVRIAISTFLFYFIPNNKNLNSRHHPTDKLLNTTAILASCNLERSIHSPMSIPGVDR